MKPSISAQRRLGRRKCFRRWGFRRGRRRSWQHRHQVWPVTTTTLSLICFAIYLFPQSRFLVELQWNVDTVLQWKSWHQIESLKQQCRQFGYCLSYLVDFSGDERKISKKFTSYLSRKLSQMGGGAVAQTRPESANASPAKFNHLSPDQETDQQGKYNYVIGSMVEGLRVWPKSSEGGTLCCNGLLVLRYFQINQFGRTITVWFFDTIKTTVVSFGNIYGPTAVEGQYNIITFSLSHYTWPKGFQFLKCKSIKQFSLPSNFLRNEFTSDVIFILQNDKTTLCFSVFWTDKAR